MKSSFISVLLAIIPAVQAAPDTASYYGITISTTQKRALMSIVGSIEVSTSVVTKDDPTIIFNGKNRRLTVADEGRVNVSTIIPTGFYGVYYGDGSNLAGVITSTSAFVQKSGDTMTGQLTLSGSTLTVTGSDFSVGGSTFMVREGQIAVNNNYTASDKADLILTGRNPGGTAGGRMLITRGAASASDAYTGIYFSNYIQGDPIESNESAAIIALTNPGGDDTSSGLVFKVNSLDTPYEAMRIASNRYVGIGSNNPISGKLVVSSGAIYNDGTGAGITTTGDLTAVYLYGDGSNLTGLPITSTAALQVDIDSRVLRAGDTMAGNLDLGSNWLDSVGRITWSSNIFATPLFALDALNISTNTYIIGYSSAATYYGDGSNLTGVITSTAAFVPYTGATSNTDLGAYNLTASTMIATGNITTDGAYQIKGSTVLNYVTSALALGKGAGAKNTSVYNMFIGDSAGANTTSGYYNTLIGNGAGNTGAVGNYNTNVGYQAAYNLGATSHQNTSLGYRAGFGAAYTDNTAIGNSAGLGWERSYRQTFIGAASGTQGSDSQDTSCLGAYSCYYMEGGANENTCAGAYSCYGQSYTQGYPEIGNTAIGYKAAYSMTKARNNIMLGWKAGYNVTTGSGNILIGYMADSPTAGTSNYLNIGDTILGDLTSKNITIVSTLTVQGNAFSVGGSTLAIVNGKIGIGRTNPSYALDVLAVNGADGLKVANTNANIPTFILAVSDVANSDWFIQNRSGNLYIDAPTVAGGGMIGIDELNPTSQLYVSSWTSSLGYIDRTDYPETKEIAYEAVLSMGKKLNGPGLDHAKMSDFVRHNAYKKEYNPLTKKVENVLVEQGRNLTATVSALTEVVKDLILRIEELEANE